MASKTVIEAIDGLINKASPSASVADAIDGLDGLVVSDGAEAISNALKPDGAIAEAIGDAIDAELDDTPASEGKIILAARNEAGAAIDAGLEGEGSIAEAIETAISGIAAPYAKAESTATEIADLVDDFNALLTALETAGVITLPSEG